MKELDYTLELADGTVVKVGLIEGTHHPEIKAFHFPPGTLVPFSQSNLPTARQSESLPIHEQMSEA
ncbi:hypothetical protein [Rhodopirellula sp. MGV]|uniref:hypothetical protein n=1 Tax=Rhodopirellula sp. MGV TaxID=2023130 RepID=UPI000B97B140|nr:hypothetical protein [Rhodopirellula sp. MGV]OYP34051.1 hypothetical protein CGZ80_16720 [Rhodopirellula sp. MGV]PNY38320.1 hypothetical protein C2E31_03125 [Rhodopirellula baltica]